MAIIKWTPLYEPFLDVERAFSDMIPTMNAMNPAIDMYEKDGNIIVEVAVAGIDPQNVKLSIEDSMLNIEASTEKKSEIDEKDYYRREVRRGSFHRMVSLPSAVNADQANANFEKGILKITLPKKVESQSKPITISVGEHT